MMSLLERTVAGAADRMVLLAPPKLSNPGLFRNIEIDPTLRRALTHQMQRLRGSAYLDDGAISREHLCDGRHQTPEDDKSWHLLTLDWQRRVVGCVWYMEHERPASVDSLRVRACPLATQDQWRKRFLGAIRSELGRSRRQHMRFVEIGGWAVARDHRCKTEGLLLALAAYGLGRLCGGAIGLTTATVRHASSRILRRIGGTHLLSSTGPVPSYFDPRYNCEMELLTFDSRRPAAKFASLVDTLAQRLGDVPVVAGHPIDELDYGYTSLPSASLSLA